MLVIIRRNECKQYFKSNEILIILNIRNARKTNHKKCITRFAYVVNFQLFLICRVLIP